MRSDLRAGTTATDESPQQFDPLIPDPAGLPPLCDETEFAALLEGMVADDAPRLFAVVQEYGGRVDGRIAGWGMAFDEHAEVISVDKGLRMTVGEPENALRAFRRGTHVRARLVWFNPSAITTESNA